VEERKLWDNMNTGDERGRNQRWCCFWFGSLGGWWLSRPTWACPRLLTEGYGRCRKRQQTEDQTCIKLGPGRLDAWMETRGGKAVHDIVISGTGGTCDSFSLNVNILGKTAVLHLAHFWSRGCANSSLKFIGHNYACPLNGVWGCAKLKLAVYLIDLCLCSPLSTDGFIHQHRK
jgi:hypothetical protein